MSSKNRIYASLVLVQEGASLSSCLGSGSRIQLCCLPSRGTPGTCWAPSACPAPQTSRRGVLSSAQSPLVPHLPPPTHTHIHALVHTHSHTFTLLLNSSLISTVLQLEDVLQFNSDNTQSEHRPHKLREGSSKDHSYCRRQTQVGSPGAPHL